MGETTRLGEGLDSASLLLDVVAGVCLLHVHLSVKGDGENYGFAIDHVRALLDHVVHARTIAEENEAKATAVAIVTVIHDAGVLDLPELAKILLQITYGLERGRRRTVCRVCAKSAYKDFARNWFGLLITYGNMQSKHAYLWTVEEEPFPLGEPSVHRPVP